MLSRSVFFSLCLLGSHLLLGQDDLVDQVTRIDSLVENGHFDAALEAIEEARRTLAQREMGNQDSTQLYFFSKLSFISSQLGDCAAAVDYGKQEMALRESIYGLGDPLYLSALRNYGIYHLNCGQLDQADSTLTSLLNLHREHVGQLDELYVRTMDDLAFTKGTLGQVDEAANLYEEILKVIADQSSGFYLAVLDDYTSLLINNERYEEAAPNYGVLKEWVRTKDGYDQFLRDFHNVFIFTKNYVKAYETARDLITLLPDEELADVKLNGARAALLMGKWDSALLYYEKAYAVLGDSVQARIRIHLERAGLYNALNSNFRELNELRRARLLHEENGLTDSASYTLAVLRLGASYSEVGQFEQADGLFADYIRFLENQPTVDHLKLAQAYQSLGNQKYLLRDFNEADAYLLQAEKILVEHDQENSTEYASCLNSLGALKEAMADYRWAKRLFRSAFNTASEQDGSLRLKVVSASNLANIINTFDPQNDSIGQLYSRAIEWQEELTGEYHPEFGNLLNKRGFAFQSRGDFDRAEQDYRRASQILAYTVGSAHPEYLVSMSNLGYLYSEQGNTDQAFSTMLAAKNIYEQHYAKDNPGYLLMANNLANLYTKMEDYSRAEELFLELADMHLRKIRESFSYLSEKEKETFVREKKKFLDSFKKYIVSRYIDGASQMDKRILTTWLELELNMKGILLNSTKKVRDQIFNSGDEQMIRLFSNWTLARNHVAQLQSLKNEERATQKTQMDSLMQRIDELEKAISRASASFGNTFSNDNVTFADIRQALGAGECAIEIVRIDLEGEALYVALYIEPGLPAPELVVIGRGESMEGKTFTTYKNVIQFTLDNSLPFDEYWRPIENRLSKSDISKVYFTPDGVYHRISLATLYDEEEKGYLFDKYDFVQLTSTKDILTEKVTGDQAQASKKVLLMGRPNYEVGRAAEETSVQLTRSFSMNNITDLPGTEAEVNEIGEVLEGEDLEVLKFLGDAAAEPNFKRHVNSNIIHIATHGFFLDQQASKENEYIDPMLYSGLLLAGVSDEDTRQKTGEDGILTAYEIMNLGFSNLDMVVLSACETATGAISSGEGVYGLQRAFFVAGANTLIMSLWKVDDQATKDLMTNFYKALIKSRDKRAAFADAQKKVKKKYKSPIYWGAFVMIGG